MRIGGFKATNFRQLERKTNDFPWELFLKMGPLPRISVTARHSRLYHKEAIADRLSRAIANRLSQGGLKPETQLHACINPHLYVRAIDDQFTISLDSSGELLYKRGIKTQGGRAPLRETLAAAALNLAGFTGKEALFDPMCGSGTFSIEGALMVQNIPPGWFRDFAFSGWPCFRPQRWAYLRREAKKRFNPPGGPSIYASDQDERVCDTLTRCLKTYDLYGTVNVFCKDFFDIAPSEISEKAGLVVINPPYGQRIGSKDESKQLFYDICQKLKNDYTGWKLALIAPTRQFAVKVPMRLDAHFLNHGGLKISLLVGRI
jgi:putative N6-adenine-specific DNA methylase